MRTVIAAVVGVTLLAALVVAALRSDHADAGTASATAFDLPALSTGGRVQLATYRGEPVIVTLFASWCEACQQELPEYATTAARLRGRVQFIGVDSQETGNGTAFAAGYHLTASGFVLAKDIDQSTTGGLYKAYGADGLPLTAFYDSTGRLLWKANAAVPQDILDQKLEQFYGV